MRAWRVDEFGAPDDVLRLADVDAPAPGPGEVLLDVGIAPLNFADDLMIRGRYQVEPPLPFTPGLEVLGRIRTAGPGAGLEEGSRALALAQVPHGALAEQTVVAADDIFPLPEEIPDEAAASMLITYQTSHVALHHRAGLRKGETLLVHAGAGGIGSAAIQLGAAAGARVIATAGGPDKVELCRKLGADVALDYREEDFAEVVLSETGGRGADVIYDSVGGDTFDRSRRCIAWEGRLVVVGFASGRIPEAPANHVMVKNYAVVGVHWGGYRERDRGVMQRAHSDLVRLWGQGYIEPVVGGVVPLSEADAALAELTGRRTVGKILVRVAGADAAEGR